MWGTRFSAQDSDGLRAFVHEKASHSLLDAARKRFYLKRPMTLSLLVLHGPNLARLADEDIDPRLESRADELELSLTIVQANGEAGLLDALHAHAETIDAVLVNPGALAPTAFALAEGLQMLGLPAVEVLLQPLAAERGQSSLTSVVKAQVHGRGVAGYLDALERLVKEVPAGKNVKRRAPAPKVTPPPAGRGKTIGRKVVAPPASPPVAGAARGKTIGRAGRDEKKSAPKTRPAAGGLTRAQVGERIRARLDGREDAAALATWARDTWAALQRGAECEPGAKDTIENVLLTLMAGAKATDAILVAQLAKLDP